MYGLISKFRAHPGKREELMALMTEETPPMRGCRSYIVARDPADADGIWITEAWDSADSHKASLQIQGVKDVIARAMPLIAGFEVRHETEPVGGVGL